MGLSYNLISEFVRTTNDKPKPVTEATVYGTVVQCESDDIYYVQLDGSDVLTPTISTAYNEVGERVTVKIKNHTATITGNITSPSASNKVVQGFGEDLKDLGKDYEIFKGLVADEALFDELKANDATIGSLLADKATIDELDAVKGRVGTLETDNLEVNKKLSANSADIADLKAKKLNAEVANITYATIDNLASTNASIKNLETDKLSAKDAEIKYANIDFANIGEAALKKIYSESGLIRDIVIGDGTITGELVGVTIKGDLIEGNTIKADKLVVKGSDGLYYKLNFEGGTFKEGEQVPEDSLHGSVLTAKSVTAEKVSVKDLVAFDATIGGFNITSNAIHSNVKSSVDNTTRGIYLDNDGQMAVGDGNNFIKYYQESPAYLRLVTDVAGGGNQRIYYDTARFKHEQNVTYTLSFKARSNVNGTVLVSCVGGNESYSKGTYTLTNSWQDYSFTYTTEIYGSLTFWLIDANTSVDIADIKVTTVDSEYILLPITSLWIIEGTPTTKSYDAVYKLAVSANSIIFGASGKNLESTFDDYTTKDEFNSLEIGGTNLIKNSDFSEGTSKWVIGTDIAAEIVEDSAFGQCIKLTSATVGSSTCRIYPSTTENFIHKGGTHSLSFYAKADAATTMQTNVAGGTEIVKDHALATEWQRYMFTYDAYGGSITFWPNEVNTTIYITKVKMEKGDKCTDWTPAPEDMAPSSVSDDIKNVNDYVSTLETKVIDMENLIAILEDSIAMLVTDENGMSLMTQVGNKWTFSTASMQDIINATSEGLSDLTNKVGDVNATVDILKQAVNDLGSIAEYVSIGTYQETPSHLHLESTMVGDSFCRIYYNTDLFTHVKDTTYTLSFRARSSVSGTVLESWVAGQYNYTLYTLGTDWQNYTTTYTANAGGSLTFWLDLANTDVDIADIKLVKSGDTSSLLAEDASSSIEYWTSVNMNVFRAVEGTNVEPCIELGEADSDFKLMITNTRIMFKDGSAIPTYINNRGLITENIEVKNDFRHCGFVWAKRANGNYGLSWKGVDS